MKQPYKSILKTVLFWLLLMSSEVHAQQQTTVTGVVTSTEGEPIPSVSIVIKGTTTGTLSDGTGKYSLKSTKGDILVFSSVGYLPVEAVVGDQPTIDVKMAFNTTMLADIVVVGYGEQSKAKVTGSVATVKVSDVLGNRPINNLSNALQGAIPGLQVTFGSGQPGAAGGINIRGFESINGGSPLVLVDNVPMNITDVNPADIESVSVLKDASAASIYGGRAAFGVVLITTKKAKKDQPIQVSYSANFTISQATSLPQKASALEYADALLTFGNTSSWTGQNLELWKSHLEKYAENPFLYPGGQTIISGTVYRLEEKDVYKTFMQNGFEQLHNLAVSGGTAKSSYRISLGYANDDGILVYNKDTYQKYNVNALISSELKKGLDFTANVLYKSDIRHTPAGLTSIFNNGAGFGNWVNTGDTTLADGTVIPFTTPNQLLKNESSNPTRDADLRLFGKIDYSPVKDWKIIGELTYKRAVTDSRSYASSNPYLAPTTYTIAPLNSITRYTRTNTQEDRKAINLYSTYEKNIGQHYFKPMLGMNMEAWKIESFTTSREEVISGQVPSLSTSTGLMRNDDSFSDYGLVGYFGRLNYAFKDRYLLELNGRYDGSSRFAKDRRFGFFPSASVGWIISAEPFMQAVHVINTLKIRASYGSIGNQDIADPYPTIVTFNPGNSGWINQATGVNAPTLFASGLVRRDFSWETVRTKNLGVDFSLLNQRLSGSFDYFERETLDMITAGAELPATLGTRAPVQNAADLLTKGWEAVLTWQDQLGDFKYSASLNVFDNTTTITHFNNAGGLLSQYYVGQNMNEIWGYVTYPENGGYFVQDDFETGSLNNTLENGKLKPGVAIWHTALNQNPGDIRYVDLNGDGKISPGLNTLTDPGDRKIIGNSNRRYQFGTMLKAAYKNFDLSVFIQGVGKRDVWINSSLFWPYAGTFEPIYKHQLDYWTPENPEAFYPRMYKEAGGNTPVSRNVQTKYLSNGAYTRLKNLEIGYTLPKIVLDKLHIARARVFFSGENLFTVDELPPGVESEVNGIARGAGYPFLKKYSLGLTFNF